jgi:hypothetical protein
VREADSVGKLVDVFSYTYRKLLTPLARVLTEALVAFRARYRPNPRYAEILGANQAVSVTREEGMERNILRCTLGQSMVFPHLPNAVAFSLHSGAWYTVLPLARCASKSAIVQRTTAIIVGSA